MIWILALVALAATPEELEAELPAALAQLEACAEQGCQRADGARAAWIVAVGSYAAEGAADGEVVATVRALDPTLFDALPDALKATVGTPLAWADRVGGQPEPTSDPTPLGPIARLDRLTEAVEAQRPRIFVVDRQEADRYANPKLRRELRKRIGRPTAAVHPAGDLCQQEPLRTDGTLDPAQDYEPDGQLDFSRGGTFESTSHASNYEIYLGGAEYLVTDPQGRVGRPPGDHQIWVVREDGVGPVLRAEETPSEVRAVHDEADRCIAEAIQEGSAALEVHFERLASRLPEAPMYVVELVDARAKNAKIWSWIDGSLTDLSAE